MEEITTSGARIFGKQHDETSSGETDLATLCALGADWFWETDSEHRFTRITEGFRSCTGHDPEQYLGRCRLDYLRRHAGRDANIAQHLGEVEAGRPFRDFAYFLEDRQGRSRLISISGEPLKDKAGNLVGYRGIGRDATGLLEAFGNGLGRHPGGEDAAPGGADSLAERLMAALNAIDDAFCYYDSDGRMLLHNTALLDMFPGLADLLQPGVSFDVLISEALERGLFVVDGADNASLRERLVSQRHEGTQTRAVFQLADGRWILHRTIPTADGGSIAIHTDITKHKQHQECLEQALEDAEAAKVRLQAGIDALDEGFVIWDENDRLVTYNQAYLRHFPYLPEIKVGWTAEELLRAFANTGAIPAAVGREEEWVCEALAARQAETDHDVVFRTHDDRWILRRDRLTESGERVGVRKDLTEQKQKENELRAAREEAERLLDDMKRMVDSLRMGVVVLDADLKTEIVNKAYFEMWGVLPEDVPVGISARELFEKARKRGVYDVPDDQWETYVAERMETLRSGNVAQQEIQRADGGTMIYSVTGLSGGKRLVTYYDVSSMKAREAELATANKTAEQLLHDFERSLDTVELGVVLLDRDLNVSIINKAFYRLWGLTPEQAPRGVSFAEIMECNRHNGIYDVADDKWEDFVAWRLNEIRNGDVEPREFARADGKTVIYAVTALSDGKRLITYFDVSGMKQREAELAEALEKSRLAEAVIDSLPNPIFVKDETLTFVMANKAFADFFGTTSRQIVGKRAGNLVEPDEANDFEASESEVLSSGELFEVEEDFELDGRTHTRMVRKNRVTTGGDRSYVACAIFDVTDMKRREMEALQARSRLANVLETLPAGVIIYDSDDRFVLANGKVHEALPAMVPAMKPGKSLREAVEIAHKAGYFRQSGDPDLDRLYDSDPEGWIEGYLARYHIKFKVFERENPDGRWFKAFDARLEDGTYVGVRVDITELKQRETELRESMSKIELFSHVLDELPVSTYVKDEELRFEFVNKTWCAMSGVGQEEAIGRTDRDFFGTEGEGFAERDLEVLRTGHMDETEETLTHRDGTLRHLIARKSRLVGRDGKVHLIGSSADISDLKQREVELQDAQHKAVLADRAKSEFLANMSHEIRTPMNGVLGMAELLAKSELDPKQKTFTDIIMKSGNALLTIINDILDFSKIDAGQMVLDPAPFNLAEAIEDVATLMSTRAKEKDLEMIVRFQPGLPESYVGDAGRLRQIITNLMGNAVKFTEAGHVLVEVTGEVLQDATRLRIAVTDTGIGIPADKLPQVFDKFSQVDSSSTRRHEGTGLGLAITSRLIELMDGEIGADSVEGEGSSFWFTVMLPNAEKHANARATPLDVTGARVLVVDDNAVNRSILMEQMASWGFDSCAAESGQEGLRVLQAASRHGLDVDCIVLDYQMPGMSGIDMARQLRASDGIRETPIVLLTSVDQSLTPSLNGELRIEAQLTKPARSSALLETLVETIQRRRGKLNPTEEPAWSSQGTGSQAVGAPATMPRSETVPAMAAPATRKPLPADRQRHRVDILVAEDNEVNQLVFTQILSDTGLAFELVGNGARAVEAWSEMTPRMILMDVSMPEMNGLEATEKIREMEKQADRRTPIIGVTAHALKGDRERCLEAGMDDYLSKPISPKALLEKISRWMDDDERGQLQA